MLLTWDPWVKTSKRAITAWRDGKEGVVGVKQGVRKGRQGWQSGRAWESQGDVCGSLVWLKSGKDLWSKVHFLVTQLCLTLCNLVDCSPPGSSVHGILQGRRLEWVAMPSSRGSSQSRDQTQISHIAGRFLYQLSYQGSPRILVFCHSLLQGIFPTQWSNWGLRHCRWIFFFLFVSFFADGFFTSWATREALRLGPDLLPAQLDGAHGFTTCMLLLSGNRAGWDAQVHLASTVGGLKPALSFLTVPFPSLKLAWDFPGGPVVKTLHLHCRGQVQRLMGDLRMAQLHTPGPAKIYSYHWVLMDDKKGILDSTNSQMDYEIYFFLNSYQISFCFCDHPPIPIFACQWLSETNLEASLPLV